MAGHLLLGCLLAGGLLASSDAWAHHKVAGQMHPVVTTVRITETVLAGGKPLAPGTYELVVNDETPQFEAGQTDAQRTVDFLQDGRVMASDVAEVFPFSERPVGTSGSSSPQAVVQRLKENDFLRIAVNGEDARYLVHLPFSRQ